MEITHLNDWLNLDENLTILTIPSNSCNERELSIFDVSGLKHLKIIEIGDDCFENVNEVRLIGLKQLKSIAIGKNSFTRYKNEEGKDPSRHFQLKQCPMIKTLKIGRGCVKLRICLPWKGSKWEMCMAMITMSFPTTSITQIWNFEVIIPHRSDD